MYILRLSAINQYRIGRVECYPAIIKPITQNKAEFPESEEKAVWMVKKYAITASDTKACVTA